MITWALLGVGAATLCEIISDNFEKFRKGEIDLDESLDLGFNVNSFRSLSKDATFQVQSLTKALVYLQKNIRDGDSRKRVNLKTLDDYRKKCKIFCFLSKWKKLVEKNMDIWEEKYR